MAGSFEGTDSERGIEWRYADSLSLQVLQRRETVRVPDHSWLSQTRSRWPADVHQQVFGWVLEPIAERGLVKGDRDRSRGKDRQDEARRRG
jgi:transposase